MIGQITYHYFKDPDFEFLLRMSKKLWTELNEEELTLLLTETFQPNRQKIIIAKTPNKQSVGFSIFSIRTDYVEGAKKAPTGYLEGIFVEPEFRKIGIAKEFIRRGEMWCKEQGCTQIGSDTWLSDTESRKFHNKVGFWEEDELVHFLKNIK